MLISNWMMSVSNQIEVYYWLILVEWVKTWWQLICFPMLDCHNQNGPILKISCENCIAVKIQFISPSPLMSDQVFSLHVVMFHQCSLCQTTVNWLLSSNRGGFLFLNLKSLYSLITVPCPCATSPLALAPGYPPLPPDSGWSRSQ